MESRNRRNGEFVSCRVVKQFGPDTVKVPARIRYALADTSKTLPKGIQLRVLIDSLLGVVERAILIGAVLAIRVLFLHHRDIRALKPGRA
jgi:cobalt-zinc-cadmium resistance protein CzcA